MKTLPIRSQAPAGTPRRGLCGGLGETALPGVSGAFVQTGTRNPKPQTPNPQRGSALIIALWTIALLSMLVMSFALDAMLEGKINVYVRQRRQVDYLTQSGIAIAEMLLLSYRNATPGVTSSTTAAGSTATGTTTASSQQTGLSEDADDKWLQAKLDLQHGSARVEEYAIDPDKPENGVVAVEITSADANKWPINLLVNGDIADRIWENVLNVIGLPMEYQEEVVDSWYDWLDPDSTVTGRSGAEDEYYADFDYKARNGPISSVAELKMIRGIRERPAIFDGGILNPEEKNKKAQIHIQYGLKAFFDIYGETVKINVNSAELEVLLTVPGIDGDSLLANAIIEERRTGANRVTSGDSSAESLLFKDWNDLNARIPGGVPTEAEPFLAYAPQKYFEIAVTGTAGGISHQIKAVAIVEGDRVRYLRWREDP
ncbi:MAG TPA: type II secretion system protein GspK [Kiritimatiellia bacterium]|nr:type II secretion system protein GspK [Kiritimatiellia bacterium]HRU71789.1 type II secretion system protein GspK [Kiritimatiellia bacterium]